jgi:hypothetical protein
MSLAVLADHMASKGRGPDSMLIHMSPREVQGLQALAVKHGGSLTINPETGLPEAGFLDKLLPSIIGAGISFFSGGTIDPMTAAGIVGGIQTARTGDIGKGISAGLGAYGGASLTSGLATTGTNVLTGEATSIAAGDAARLAGEEAVRNGIANNFTPEMLEAAKMEAIDTAGSNTARLGTDASNFDKLSTGAKTAANNPLQYLKDNAKPLMMAAGPAILAEMGAKKNMPQTVTQPGMIRPYSYDPISQQYFGGTPYRAAEGGIMGFDESSNSPMSRQSLSNMQDSGGMFNYAHDGGGVMKMAQGGIAGYADGGAPAMLSDEALYQKTGSWEAAAAARDAQNNALNQYNWAQQAAAPIAQVQAAPAAQAQAAAPAAIVPDASNWWEKQPGGVNAMYDYINNQLNTTFKNATDAQVDAAMKQYGISNEDVAGALRRGGGSQAEEYSLLAGNMGLSGLNQNINSWIAKANTDPRFKNLTPEQKRQEAINAMGTVNMNEADVLRATGKTIAELFPKELTCPPGYHKSADGLSCEKDKVVAGNFTEVPLGLFPGAGGGGNTVVNANGSITTGPNIPGIPAGGFTGMGQVRDVYTQGGGSLGYTSPTYTSLKAVEDKYPLTGGSKQSYDYLTGKTPYDPVPYTKTGEIMKPYGESVLGLPANISKKMYLFDPTTKTYKVNPDYAIPTRNEKGQVTTSLTNKDVADYVGKAPSYDALYSWMTANNLSPEQVALASGKPFAEINKQFIKAQGITGDDGKIDTTKLAAKTTEDEKANFDATAYLKANQDVMDELNAGKANFGTKDDLAAAAWEHYQRYGKAQNRPLKAAEGGLAALTMARGGISNPFFSKTTGKFTSRAPKVYADGGMANYNLGGYSDGGRLLRGPGDGVSDSIPATIGDKRPARLADGEFVVPARIVSELGNGSTEAGARKLYAMMDRVQAARKGSIGKGKVANNSRSDKYLPA